MGIPTGEIIARDVVKRNKRSGAILLEFNATCDCIALSSYGNTPHLNEQMTQAVDKARQSGNL